MVDVNVEFTLEPDVTYNADIMVETAIKEHNKLSNRDLPNQHPMSAITGLEEAIAEASDKTFVYEQGISSAVWVINHNLNKYPSITLVDSQGLVFKAQEEYNDLNTVTIYLNGATTGKAYLN